VRSNRFAIPQSGHGSGSVLARRRPAKMGKPYFEDILALELAFALNHSYPAA
jgi:hypothetical protein